MNSFVKLVDWMMMSAMNNMIFASAFAQSNDLDLRGNRKLNAHNASRLHTPMCAHHRRKKRIFRNQKIFSSFVPLSNSDFGELISRFGREYKRRMTKTDRQTDSPTNKLSDRQTDHLYCNTK